MSRYNPNLIYSVLDQSVVSAGNFLTIALGAKYLSLADQGKLVYLYSIYIGIVLINISAFFNSANIVQQELNLSNCYKKILFSGQVCLALLFLGIISVWFFYNPVNSQALLSWNDVLVACCFIFCQQISDFYRRSGYVFDYIPNAFSSSLWVYSSRIIGIYTLKPGNFSEFVFIMIVPSLPIIAICLYTQVVNLKNRCNRAAARAIITKHVQLSKWNIANTPLKWAGLHLPILLVAGLHSIEASAILGSVRAITTFANVFLELFETFIPTWLTQSHAENSQSLGLHCLTLLKIGGAFWLIGIIGIYFYGAGIISIILGNHYVQHTFILYVSWLAVGLSFIGRVMSLYYRIKQAATVEFFGSLLGVAVMLACVGILPKSGAEGGAWILVIFQISSLIGMYLYRKYNSHEK